jgi:hypothetical protein
MLFSAYVNDNTITRIILTVAYVSRSAEIEKTERL